MSFSRITTNQPPKNGRYKWYVVGMLWFICFFNYADRQAVFAIFPLLKKDFGFNTEQLGLIGTAFIIIYALTAPVAGPIGDRRSRKTLIIGGLYVWSIVTGLTSLCTKVWQFVIVRGSEGLGETFYFPASMSMVSDYHSKSTRSRAMSLHQTGVYVGTIGGSAFAGWMGERYGWRSPFLIFGLLGIVLGLALSLFIREPERDEAQKIEDGEDYKDASVAQIPMTEFIGEWLHTPTAVILAAAFFGANLVAMVFLVWMPTFLNEKFHMDVAKAGLGATIYIQAASMAGAAGGGYLADRWRRNISGGRILTQAIGTLLGAPFIFLCGYTRNMSVLIGAMTLFGLFKGLYDGNIWAGIYDVIPVSRRSAAVGIMNFVGWTGGAIGAFGIGVAAFHGITMSAAISSTAIIYLLVGAALFVAAIHYAPRDVTKVSSDLHSL